MTKPRVFVSSVVDGFEEFREAARRGIERGGGEPVLVNEDLPATGRSSRNACLDAVQSCDIYLTLIGSRGGWTAPSGKLVVEEEYEHALKRKLPVLAFIQDVARDADAERLRALVSHFIDGAFRRMFVSPSDLEAVVAEAVRDQIATLTQPLMSAESINERLSKRSRVPNDVAIRIVLAPERDEEIVSPVELGSKAFADGLYSIGHAGAAPLFSFQQPKSHHVRSRNLVVEQTNPNGRHDSVEYVWMSIDESGVLEIEANVTSRRPSDGYSLASSSVVLTDDMSAVIASALGFAAAFFQGRDPHKRYQRFLYNVALLGLGHRLITRDATPKSSYSLNMFRGDKTIIAFDSPRTIGRIDLDNPAEEIARVVTVLERASNEQ